MELSRTEQALFILLRAGLWNRNPDNLAIFPLSETEWKQVYEMADKQTVTGIVFQGITLLEDDLMPPFDLLQLWVAHVERIENANKRMNRALSHLLAFFRDLKITPIILKGQGVAQLYEDPLTRNCGDIDLYFDSDEEKGKALSALSEKGMEYQQMADGAILFKWEGIEVEIHGRLLDIYNPFCKKDIRRLIKRHGFSGNLPTPLLNMLLLNTHVLKHVVGPGIGLRQLADLARAHFKYHGLYDETEYTQICKRWHIGRWTRELEQILVTHIGLDKKYVPSGKVVGHPDDYILRKVLEGGNFGKYHGEGKNGKIHNKWYTVRHSLGSFGNSFRLAPTETIWYLSELVKGQIKVGRLGGWEALGT